ncbi:CDP-alcohol phosphatidyltransferase family protein [Pseudovibrio brasiliensis]|uniref:CDP-alcohol phosphatidyltransferase family protein n=1 Tax=Pseudovibrio brasiliensis TaxID=1898042 RepID=A0ABX8AUT6_9HYPH|nr:CDP-alcohol phosphatidyltransferase family protein [Pseudovibrio brasiliensis]QUS57011.1 CDP-alcohol phosphatidyltransferase family protein [Pseudovibrio brasiliensis]
MFDAKLRGYIDPPLNRMGKALADLGITANAVTLVGLGFGLAAAAAVAAGQFYTALLFILLNRFADGLDGAIARAVGSTNLGGFYDITFDFIFYGAIPLAFAFVAPEQNALAAAALLFSFYINGSTFLAFATLAQKLGMQTTLRGKKSFYYLGGLAEGFETIGVFVAFCLFPTYFSWVAWTFAAICTLSAISRVFMVRHMVLNHPDPSV